MIQKRRLTGVNLTTARALDLLFIGSRQIGLYDLNTVLEKIMTPKLSLRARCILTVRVRALKVLWLLIECLWMLCVNMILEKLRSACLIGAVLTLVFEVPAVLHPNMHTDRADFPLKLAMRTAREAICRLRILLGLWHCIVMW